MVLVPLVLTVNVWAAEPPATVLEHSATVFVDAARRATETATWVVRIDDPKACSAGIPAPPGLDGAADRGAQVFGNLFVVPPGTEAGATFTLTNTRTASAASHSGQFHTAPDLRTERASLVVEAAGSGPYSVWADPTALVTVSERPRRTTISWTDLDTSTLAEAVWSTHQDWMTAGEPTAKALAAKRSDQPHMGREVAGGVDGLGVGGITERVFETVKLEGGDGDYLSARNASQIAKSGHGTAAERAIVLVTLLEIAGFKAQAGYFRQSRQPGRLPYTVPAPALLPKPMVAVSRLDGTVYVDPSASRVAVPENPASMLGATVWIPGVGLPTPLPDRGGPDGELSIRSTFNLSEDGSASFSSQIVPSGAATEYLRDLLVPLDDDARTDLFLRLIRRSRPDVDRVHLKAMGVEDANKKLVLLVTGQQPAALAEVAYGLRGQVPPMLAAALSAWLPPKIAVLEWVAIGAPPALRVVGRTDPPPACTSEVVVSRDTTHDGHQLVHAVEVYRPSRKTTPASDAAAAEFLSGQAPLGVELVLLLAEGSVTKALRNSTLAPAERAVLEALSWLGAGKDRKAVRVLGKAMPVAGFNPLVDAIVAFADPRDTAPFDTLALVPDMTDVRRVTLAEGRELAGARRDAYLAAVPLVDSADPEARLRAALLVERVASFGLWGEVPSDPHALLAKADEAGRALWGGRPDARVITRQAELRLQGGSPIEAEGLLDTIDQTPLVRVLRANARAQEGLPASEVRAAVRAALSDAPNDAAVAGAAADALLQVGARADALEHGLLAARLAGTDAAAWSRVVPFALAAGRLAVASEAARRASDLDRENGARAHEWALLATMSLDKDGVDMARVRAGMDALSGWPPSVDDRLMLDDGAMLAVLEHADTVVAADPRLLAVRFQLRMAAGLLDDAAQDGLLLATVHGRPEGMALAHAATAGRQTSTVAQRALDEIAKTHSTGMSTRMELRLFTGLGDPLEDATRLGDDARAKALLARGAPQEGWPTTLTAPSTKAPPGFRPNRVLTSPGIVAFSRPDWGATLVRVGGETSTQLPPPIAQLYTGRGRGVARLKGGGQVLRLDGGIIPLYAATAMVEGQTIWGFAFTLEGAKRALAAGLPEAEKPLAP